jgi:hypothetical protein
MEADFGGLGRPWLLEGRRTGWDEWLFGQLTADAKMRLEISTPQVAWNT